MHIFKIRLRSLLDTIESYLDAKNQKKLWSRSSGIHPDRRTEVREQIYSPSQILGSVQKGVKNGVDRQKRCEIANIEEFSIENPYKPYLFL